MSCKTVFILNLLCFWGATRFPAKAHIHSLGLVISHICTEELGKKLWPYNKAALLQLTQRDCNNNNRFSVATGNGFLRASGAVLKWGSAFFAVKRSSETFRNVSKVSGICHSQFFSGCDATCFLRRWQLSRKDEQSAPDPVCRHGEHQLPVPPAESAARARLFWWLKSEIFSMQPPLWVTQSFSKSDEKKQERQWNQEMAGCSADKDKDGGGEVNSILHEIGAALQ